MIQLPRWQELSSRATHLRRAGVAVQAIDLLIRAIELTKPKPELTNDTGDMLNYLADTYLQEGMLIEAESTIREAMQYENGRGGPITACNLMILAKVMHEQGRCDEAVRTGKQALALRRRELGWRNDYYRQSKKVVASFKKPPVAKLASSEKVAG
jgi:tetratricopeptide (TPR) repeat protein